MAARAGALAFLTLALGPVPPGGVGSESIAGAPLRSLTAAPSAALPGFTLPDLAGVPLGLDGQRGRVVLVHFFATWCEPCRVELASLSRLAEGPLGGRIVIVAVNVAEVPARVRRFLEAAPVAFAVVLDAERAVTRAWGIGVLPSTYVLDPVLRPAFFVEGDVDWQRPDILAALASLGGASEKNDQTPSTSTGRSQ